MRVTVCFIFYILFHTVILYILFYTLHFVNMFVNKVVQDMIFTSRMCGASSSTSFQQHIKHRPSVPLSNKQRNDDTDMSSARMLITRSSSMATRSATPEKVLTRSKTELRSVKSFPPATAAAKSKDVKLSKVTKILEMVNKVVDAVIDNKEDSQVKVFT